MPFPIAAVRNKTGMGDTVAPTVVITCAQSPGPTGAAALNMTFTLSEDSTDFTIGDITVGGAGGTKSNFAGSGSSYTCNIAPTAAGTLTVDVATGAFHDAAGNENVAAAQFSIVATLPFEDLFTRSDGDLANDWVYTAGKWTIASGRALGTPGLGSNLYTNPGFDSDTAWTKGTGWSIGSGVASKAAGTASDLSQSPSGLVSLKDYVRFDVDIPTYVAGGITLGTPSITWTPTETGTGAKLSTMVIGSGLQPIGANSAADLSVDNATIKKITLADMFCTRDFETADINISIPLTHISSTLAGLVMCLDSVANPQNYIIATLSYLNNRLILWKVLSGQPVEVQSSTVTYVADRIVRLTKLGTTVKIYYNEVQIGTDRTISDSAIKDNTIHGMFSTYSGNTMASFNANPT